MPAGSPCDCGFDYQPGDHIQTTNCEAYNAALRNLEAEEANLLARPVPSSVAKVLAGFQPYVKARFATAECLVRFGTCRAAREALGHFNTLLRIFLADDLRTREYIPHLLLKLHRDQSCYDFVKWWAEFNYQTLYHGGYDLSDTTFPFLDIHDADPFEPVDRLCASGLSLSHLVALTLLKLRLYLDISAFDVEWKYPYFKGHLDSETDRKVGKIAKLRFDSIQEAFLKNPYRPDEKLILDYPTAYVLDNQFTKLIRAVHDVNPHFWETLVDSLTSWTRPADDEAQAPSAACLPGTKGEAKFVVSQTLPAWKQDDEVSATINLSTCDLVSVYQPPVSAVAGVTGRVFPSKFQPDPPTSDPSDVFHPPLIGNPATNRFFKNGIEGAEEILVYTAGACVNDGQPDARGAWAVVYKEPAVYEELANGIVAGRLENRGPDGDITEATSHRAELRAAVSALRLADWRLWQKIKTLVIATHSSYVVDIATFWAKRWAPNGWKTATGGTVKNKDLWILLLREVKQWSERGLRVQFWRTDEKHNQLAITAAKEATCDEEADVEEFVDIVVDKALQPIATIRPLHSPRAVVLCLLEEVDMSIPKALYKHIDGDGVRPAHTQIRALDILHEYPPPNIIIITDGAIAKGRRELFECVADRLHQGATVVIMGMFAKRKWDFNRFFARLGVPWRYSWQSRRFRNRRMEFNRRVVLNEGFANQVEVPLVYRARCVYLQNVARSEMWYSMGEVVSNVAPVALTRVGRGMLGFIGDVNATAYWDDDDDKRGDIEAETVDIMLAMCRLLG